MIFLSISWPHNYNATNLIYHGYDLDENWSIHLGAACIFAFLSIFMGFFLIKFNNFLSLGELKKLFLYHLSTHILLTLIYLTMMMKQGVFFRHDGAEVQYIRFITIGLIYTFRSVDLFTLPDIRLKPIREMKIFYSIAIGCIFIVSPLWTTLAARLIWFFFGYIFQFMGMYLFWRNLSDEQRSIRFYGVIYMFGLHLNEIILLTCPMNIRLYSEFIEDCLFLGLDITFWVGLTILLFYVLWDANTKNDMNESDEEQNEKCCVSFSFLSNFRFFNKPEKNEKKVEEKSDMNISLLNNDFVQERSVFQSNPYSPRQFDPRSPRQFDPRSPRQFGPRSPRRFT